MEPAPTSRRCSDCMSYRVAERRVERDGVVQLVLHCNSCRRDVVFFSGTKSEAIAFKRRRRKVKRMLSDGL